MSRQMINWIRSLKGHVVSGESLVLCVFSDVFDGFGRLVAVSLGTLP